MFFSGVDEPHTTKMSDCAHTRQENGGSIRASKVEEFTIIITSSNCFIVEPFLSSENY